MIRDHRVVLRILGSPAVILVAILIIAPLLMLLAFSFCQPGSGFACRSFPSFGALERLFDTYVGRVMSRTFLFAIGVAIATALIGFPVAYTIVHSSRPVGAALLFLVVLPIMLSIVVRSYSWILIYGRDGLLNTALGWLGIDPMTWMHTPHGLFIAFVQLFLPYMVIPVLNSLEKVDPNLEHAAASLGARGHQVIFRVLLPMSLPGLQAGFTLVFALCSSVLVASALLGGARQKFLGNEIYDQLFVGTNLPQASALTLVLLTVSLVVVLFIGRAGRRKLSGRRP